MVSSFYPLSLWAIRLLIFVSLSAWGGYLQAQTPGVVTTQRFSYTGQIVTWTVPTGITSLTIEARGAQGGGAPSSTLPAGKGAIISGTVAVTSGQSLSILVGGQPTQSNNGGGGSFVVTTGNAPLIIAGGGGGSGFNNDSEQKHGQAATSGGAGAGGGGAGGVDGQGGKSTTFNTVRYGAGGGLLTDGEGDGNRGGKAFVNGGTGGFNGLGGFGGGGLGTGTSNGGGGGGYSGGGVGGATDIFGVGGGGGSFTAGTRLVALSGTNDGNSGNGLVTITYALPAIRYVKQGGSGTGDGTSWTNASGDLQSQIIAPGVEQVWVAAGTYKPTTGTNRTLSFLMKEAVAIYGGFVGTETTLSQRPTINPVGGQPSSTTLSGDIGTPGDNRDNVYHVISNNSNYGVNLTSRAVLDGFVITGGNANGSEPIDRGAGIFNINSSPTLLNCSLVGNSAVNGGGIFNQSSSPTLTNCSLVGNTATAFGGGILSLNNSRPILTNCSLAVNTANDGGGMVNLNSNPVLTNCSFLNNRAGTFGGAMYNGGSRPSLTNCSLQANVARLGGAIAVLGNSQATLTNGSLQSNTATASGGVFFSDNSDLLLTNCSFQSNLSSVGSGNVLVAQNGGRRVLTNCVVYGNGVGTAFGAAVTATYCLFENTVTNYSPDPTNRTTATSPFVSTASVALNSCAPAIDTGSNEAYTAAGGGMPPSPPTDLVGNTRLVGSSIDMGAVEFQGTPNTQTAFTQPPASATGCVGSSLSIPFSVNGTGPFGVQLYRQGVAVGPARSSTVLSFTSLQPADAGSYQVVVTGTCNSVTSTAFSLSVTPQSPDYQPLADLYNATNGAGWIDKANWLSGCSPCGWFGVRCDGNGRVTAVDLRYNNLSGTIPASLSTLTNLQELSLQNNVLSGDIPSPLANLSNLKILNLGQNQLSGPVPGSFSALTGLQVGYFNNNQLSGCFPASLSAVCGKLQFGGNPSLPGGGDFDAFCASGAGSNAFAPLATASPNPVCAGSPVSLSVSAGTFYQWSGPGGYTATTQTPAFTATTASSGVYSVTVGNGSATCTATASVSLTVNALPVATITPSATAVCAGQSALFAATPGLASYRWSTPNNGPVLTTASISASVVGTYSLTVTNADGCTATAQASLTVTPYSPDYQPLVDFYNSTSGPNWTRKDNWLTGCTPCDWYGVSCDGNGRVTGLALPNNQLSGPLSASLGNLTSLQSLIVNGNQLTGSLPVSLSALTQLQFLQVDFNQFTGNIPAGYGNLTNLQILNLSQNQLSGPIPASLGNITNLQELYLNNNQLSGCFPASLSVFCGRSVNLRSNPGLPDGGDLEGFCSRGAGSDAFRPLASASPNPVCAGSPVSLSVSAGTFYQWGGPGGFTASTQTPGFTPASAANSGVYSVTVGNGSPTCTATASVSLTVNALPVVSIVGLPASLCQEAAPVSLTGTGNPAGGSFTIDGITATTLNPASLSVGQHTVVYSVTNASGCSATVSQMVTIKATPAAPVIATQTGQPYLAGQRNLTVSQNVGNVILTVSGCAGGTITWRGGSATTLSVSTTSLGTQSFTALCQTNGCTSPLATATLTVVPTTLAVLHRDPDNGQVINNTIKPYLLLTNAGNTPIPYGEISVRYWLTVEDPAPLRFQFGYVAVGVSNLQVRYVALDQPRLGATGYVEYRFSPSTGSLGARNNSGEIQNTFTKQTYSGFDQRDDHSYVLNRDYTLNARITAYQGGTIVWGVEPLVGGAGARVGLSGGSAEVSGLSVRVLGNPVVGSAIALEVRGAEGQPVRLQLSEVGGRLVSERMTERAGAVERLTLPVGAQPAGLLLLRVSTPTQSQTVKVLKTD